MVLEGVGEWLRLKFKAEGLELNVKLENIFNLLLALSSKPSV